MTRGLARVCLGAAGAVAVAGFSCDSQGTATVLQVALRSSASSTTGVDLLAGDTVGIVQLNPDAPTTLASAPAGHLLEPFRAALNETSRPAMSSAVTVSLPDPPPGRVSGAPLDIVWFRDVNGDGAWQRGEPYTTAWTGGRGGFRLILEALPAAGRPRWRLIEGGEPPTEHPDPSRVVVYIDPVRPAAER